VKTISLKKVSAVAVASLGFGLLSVVPAQAADTSPTVGTATQSGVVGTAKTTTIGFTAAATSPAAGTTVSLTVPTGSTVTLADNDGKYSTGTTVAFSLTGATASNTAVVDSTTGAVTGVTTAAAVVIGTITIVPDVPGLYIVNIAATGATTAKAYIHVAGAAGTIGTSGLGTTSIGATTGGEVAFTFTNASTDASGTVYKVSSTGVGSMVTATGVRADGTTSNAPVPSNGSAADWTQGAKWTTGDAASATMTVRMTSAAAGVQTVSVVGINATTGAPVTTSTVLITYGAAVAISAASTAYMAGPAEATDANFTSTSNAIPRSADKAAGTAIATVAITLVGSKGTADARANSVRATMSGAGFVDVNGTVGSLSNSSQRTDANVEADATRYVRAYADGTSGTGTLTVTITDVDSGASLTLGTWTVTSTGSQASIAVAATNYTVGRAGYTTGTASTVITAAGAVLNPLDHTTADNDKNVGAFVVVVKDSSGNPVNSSALPAVISSDTTVSSGGTCALDAGSATYGSSTNGIGYYNCSFATTSTAKSGGKATLTIRIADPLSTTGGYLTTTVAVTVGEKTAKTTLSTDKASYAPGEAMIVTAKAVDASGNPVYDGAASVVPTSSKALGGTALSSLMTGWYVGGVDASSTTVAKAKVFAPAQSGSFTLTGTDSTLAIVTAAASVTDANAGLLTQIDALNAKIVALNALIAKIMKKLGVK